MGHIKLNLVTNENNGNRGNAQVTMVTKLETEGNKSFKGNAAISLADTKNI